jgi:histone-lysine N-methyltransferase SETMAR
MATFFWDSEGIIMVDYLPHGETITGAYYAALMRQLREAIKEKRRGKLRKGALLLYYNVRPHAAEISTTAIRNCGFELVPHPHIQLIWHLGLSFIWIFEGTSPREEVRG